jgi:hypothetical protein
MIAKGNLHAHGVKLAAYLTANYANERAELAELRGFAALNIRDAFRDVHIQAAATRAEKPFFHAYVRAPEGEALTRETWQIFADRLEKRLGFADQPRAVAFHHKADGETHMHIAWSRIDLETLTAIDPGLYKNKMKQLCREFEKEFGLTLVRNERADDVKTQAPNRAEFEQSRRLGTDLKEIRNTINACWQSADNGRAFAMALAQEGLVLARGDKRDFVVIDRDGGDHALSKRITGATAAETRRRMADLDRSGLPSVDAAKTMQRERPHAPSVQDQPMPAAPGLTRRKQTMSEPDKVEPGNDSEAAFAEQRDRLLLAAGRLQDAERTQADMPSAQRYREQMARDAAAAAPNEQGAPAKEGMSEAAYVEQRDRLVRDAARLGEAERGQAEMHSARRYREQMEREAEDAKKAEQERRQRDADRAAAGDIADAKNRYAQALGATYTIRNPYGSLANAAMAEYSEFHRQQAALKKEAAAEQDPDKRRLIDLRREIEGHEYMAITSERLAGISRAITMGDNAGARRDDERAKAFTALAEEKRQERTDLQRELKQRQIDERAATEGGGLGTAAQQGAAAINRERSQPRSKAEEALLQAAGRHAPPERADQAARVVRQQQEDSKQREGLRPDQPSEGAPPTKETREMSVAEKALRSAAGPSFRDPAEGARDTGRQQSRPQGRGGGRSGR